MTRLGHSLQAASRAEDDGADLDWIVAALVHDIGDGLAPENHSQLAAAIVRPYVGEEVTWVVQMHGLSPGLLRRSPPWPRSPRTPGVPQPPVVRELRALLRAVGPGGVRPGPPDAPTRALRADGARGVQPPSGDRLRPNGWVRRTIGRLGAGAPQPAPIRPRCSARSRWSYSSPLAVMVPAQCSRARKPWTALRMLRAARCDSAGDSPIAA